ncbi:MAG TPA: FeoA family protein [Anaerolineales bacterium]|jgi:Fe2+ transport system protein FeoA|nr:FeoA family protein [Anaerolineales bacterium]
MRYKGDVTSLLKVPVGKTVILLSVGDSLKAKLVQYGLHVGDSLQVVRVAPLGGPVLISVNDREIALGRAVAEKIFVEVE